MLGISERFYFPLIYMTGFLLPGFLFLSFFQYLMPFIQLESLSQLQLLCEKKRKVQGSPWDLGPWQSSRSTVVPPGTRTGNYKMRTEGQREGGCRAHEGERVVTGASVSLCRDPKRLPGEPTGRTRGRSYNSTPSHSQHCLPNKTGASRGSKRSILCVQGAARKSKPALEDVG